MPVGKKIKMYYDPRGNVIRTVNPDNSEQWVVYGKPNTLSSIAINNSWSFKNYAPTPWESYTYDADDLASVTGGGAYGHDFTPKSITVDALGRTVKTIDRLSQSASDDVVMKYQYDIRGNLLKVIDALNRIAFTYTYDLRPQPKKQEGEEEKKLPPISTWHIDSGAKTNISDVTGKAIELDDAKGAQVLSGYDTINRPINIWERDNTGETTTLRQHLIYGDSAGLPTPVTNNYLGKLYQQYDEAGLQQINNYDFKGNITDKFRQVISDTTLLSVFGGSTVNCYRVNWQALDTSILDTHEHQTNSAYDALNRVTALTYPEDVSVPAKRKVLLPTYNNAGALENVVLLDDIGGIPTTYVNHIAYNAKGQRILIAFGNTVMTRYAYDKKTFRLKRQRTETYAQTGWTFASAGSVKQDTAYQYDLIGNILATNDATTGCGVGGLDNLLRQFTYDALYRLKTATGRENAPLPVPIWDDSYRSDTNGTTTGYTQRYQYDKMGNIKQLKHEGASDFTRNFNYNITTNNQLQSVDIGLTNYAFTYDANGNQLTETSNRKFEWDAADRMRSFYVEASGSITKYTQYLYDAGGNRVKKLTWVQSGDYDSSTYIDGIFEYRTDGTDKQNTLHVMDDKSRIATVRLGADFGDTTPAIKYNIEDHLGSSTIQLRDDGADINKEEYYPFGETSFGSYAMKRYKYCGKERDDESGLYYYGARYYNAWCCRFVSVDPLKDKYAHLSPYNYAGNKPVNATDIDGMQGENESNSESGNKSNDDYNKGEKAVNKTTSDIDLNKIYPSGNLPKPGDKPSDFSHLIGTDFYYEARAIDFELRNPGKTAPDYYRNYGNKYLHEFKYETRDNLSPQGQKWLGEALKNLQKAMEKELKTNPNIESNSTSLKKFAFKSHVNAYERAGVLNLNVMDKVKILLTVSFDDIRTKEGLTQALNVGIDQLKVYKDNPLFAIKQVIEIEQNGSAIQEELRKYFEENTGIKINPVIWKVFTNM